MTLDFDFIYNADNDIFEYLLRFLRKIITTPLVKKKILIIFLSMQMKKI